MPNYKWSNQFWNRYLFKSAPSLHADNQAEAGTDAAATTVEWNEMIYTCEASTVQTTTGDI